MMNGIQIWNFDDAPDHMKELPGGTVGNEEWVALIPPRTRMEDLTNILPTQNGKEISFFPHPMHPADNRFSGWDGWMIGVGHSKP